MSNELLVAVTSMVPAVELQGAIPLGLIFGFGLFKTYLLAVLTNGLGAFLLLLFWKGAADIAEHHSQVGQRFFTWVFRHNQNQLSPTAKLAALAIFTSLPVPFTGIYTVSILATLFRFTLWKSFFAILLGIALEGILLIILWGRY